MDALGETMAVDHPADRQVLDGDHVELPADAATVLMGEVAAPPPNAFMYARHGPAPLGARRRPFLLVAEAALRLGERAFLTPEEAWVGDLLAAT
jgi:hypothetical protein